MPPVSRLPSDIQQAKHQILGGKKRIPHASMSDMLVGHLLLMLPEGAYVWREFRFHKTRKWRFDLAIPSMNLAIEVDGGGFIPGGGRHSRGAGMAKDNEKIAEAMCLGWRVLRVTPQQVKSGQALTWIEKIIKRLNTT